MVCVMLKEEMMKKKSVLETLKFEGAGQGDTQITKSKIASRALEIAGGAAPAVKKGGGFTLNFGLDFVL